MDLQDMEETKNPGPYKEITDADIFVNCIYLRYVSLGSTPTLSLY